MAKRVFELAKEIGVTSKDVLTKCRAEGIDLKNHMSALSAGLAATIQEWFTEGAAQTAIEVAEHVDLAAARKKAAAERRKRKKAKAEEVAEQAVEEAVEEVLAEVVAEAPAAEAAVAPAAEAARAVAEAAQAEQVAAAPEAPAAAEAPTEAPVEVSAEAPAASPSEPVVAAEAEPAAEAAQAPQPAAVEEQPPSAGEPAPAESKAVRNVPKRPEVVKPAGPQVVPAPAKLQGPRVVRFEGLEVEIGSSRPASGGGGGAGSRAPAAPGRGGKKFAATETQEEGKTRRTRRRSPRHRGGRGTDHVEGIREWRDRDLVERSERLAAASGKPLRRLRASVGRAQGEKGLQYQGGEVEVDAPITVKGFSAAMGIKIADIIRKCIGMGVMTTINQVLERETAEAIALEYGIQLRVKAAKSAEDEMEEELAKQSAGGQGVSRPPVVTFLGHVDHGKTSLLDRIRSARVAAGEEGGITQHIGSYRYDVGDAHVVFLDTPGHEAFTAMRARGANMTDVVVLVVAADDGVMPQTLEAIAHARAAGVPIVVALNKIDLPNANVQRVLGQLAEHGLSTRQWGGETEVIQTSATTGEGIDTLVETLSLEAQLLELKAHPEAPASGYVVESLRDPSQGVRARLLVRDGTLRVGDAILCGHAYGRVRRITDDRGKGVDEAPPATPVEIIGLDDVPDAGDRFHVLEDMAKARDVAEERRRKQRDKVLAAAPRASLEDIFGRIEAGEASEIRLILKADVQGSLEAIVGSIAKLGNEEVKVQVLHQAVGGISEGDVLLAEASDAIILGFSVVADARARMLAEQKGVEIRTYRVIYQLIEDLEQAVVGMLTPETAEKVTGRVEVREVFKISRLGAIAGGFVQEGLISRNSMVRIIRDNVIVEDGRQLDSLRRFKDDAREVRAGLECGLKIAGFDDVKVGDVIEAYQTVEIARTK